MKTVWLVNADRYGDESRAKSKDGKLFGIIETTELLIEEYEACEIKPEIKVVAIGLGHALSDFLTHSREIPHTRIEGIIHRVGSADVIKYREEEII